MVNGRRFLVCSCLLPPKLGNFRARRSILMALVGRGRTRFSFRSLPALKWNRETCEISNKEAAHKTKAPQSGFGNLIAALPHRLRLKYSLAMRECYQKSFLRKSTSFEHQRSSNCIKDASIKCTNFNRMPKPTACSSSVEAFSSGMEFPREPNKKETGSISKSWRTIR